MVNNMAQIFVIAGPNGAGKTTSARKLLPGILQCEEYVNADAVAAGLSPFHPESVAMQAGRLMLERIYYLSNQGIDFAFETTLASKTFIRFLRKCNSNGYVINILFLWLNSSQLAIQRVKSRVEQGGHDIPQEVIVRRYYRSIYNFLTEYTIIATNWFLYDNCGIESKLIARKIGEHAINIVDNILWQNINGELKNESKEH